MTDCLSVTTSPSELATSSRPATLAGDHTEAEMAEILGIPDGIGQIALPPVAYTIGTDFKPASRKSVGEITYLDSWESPWPT
jgi:hypothetical protein